MSENEIQKTGDDEISLIDLLVVLLKNRRLIMIFAVLGLVVSAVYCVVQIMGGGQSSPFATGVLAGNYEGQMTVVINPRFGKSGTDKFPAWFGSRELLETALEEAGLDEREIDTITVTYNQNDGVDVVLKPGPGDREHVEEFFSVLLDDVETMAAEYYTVYAEDIVSYFEALRETEKDYAAQDYVRYRWAKDFLAGDDTVLKMLYPPFIDGEFQTTLGVSGSASTLNLALAFVLFFVFLFFAVFLAFVLNAIKNISSDNEVMAKIRGALGKGDGD
jgi:hypothetical protein